MFSTIAMLLGSLFSFAGSLAGVPNNSPLNSQKPLITSQVKLCYDPRPDEKVTLTWPNDFVNVADNRKTLNPAVFGNAGSTFNTGASCQQMLLNSKPTRTYIKVRSDTRISSCKTDELAGPFANGQCPAGNDDNGQPNPQPVRNRGSCNINGYTDLRKVAQTPQGNEIFWVPFSHNAGCNYELGNNCGPGDRRNANLKDFIYVLKSRDAFSPNDNPGCPALWDAGSTNQKACSHYFDVYMAEDLWNKFKMAVQPGDPDYEVYGFFKQAIENCHENATFFPLVPDPKFSMPPTYLEAPFVPTYDFNLPNDKKIVPQNALQQNNYKYFITSAPNIKQGVTGLMKFNETKGVIKECPTPKASSVALLGATAIPLPTPITSLDPSCYAPLGNVSFEKDVNGGKTKFNVYSRYDTPGTFYLKEAATSATSDTIYQYTPTDDKPPVNTQNDRTLQLRTMAFSVANDWTWATPWCKPAVYLYPEKETNLNVKLTVDGKLNVSNPTYNPENGWNVKASPSGNLQLTAKDQRPMTYPYLYYEADVKNINLPNKGYVVAQNDLTSFLTKTLTQIGFNDREISDFKQYWIPRLTKFPYYFVGLMPQDVINTKEKLTFSENPETLIRARFVFEALNGPLNVLPPDNLPHYERKGFTVTDWGGTLVGEDCHNVTVQ